MTESNAAVEAHQLDPHLTISHVRGLLAEAAVGTSQNITHVVSVIISSPFFFLLGHVVYDERCVYFL